MIEKKTLSPSSSASAQKKPALEKTQSQGQISAETPRKQSHTNKNRQKNSNYRYMQSTQSRSRHARVSKGSTEKAGRTRGGRGGVRNKHRKSSQPISYSSAARLSGVRGDNDVHTREIQAIRAEYESSAGAMRSLSNKMFGNGTGISDDELNTLLNQSTTIIELKNSLKEVLAVRKEFLASAVDIEKSSRAGWEKTLQKAVSVDDDRSMMKTKVRQLETDRGIWKDNAKDSMRELSVAEEKVEHLTNEMDALKEQVQVAEQLRTEAMIALEVTKARSEAHLKQSEAMKTEIEALEASKAKELENAKAEAARGAADEEKTQLKEEVGEQKNRIKELEAKVQSKEMELQKATLEKESAVERATSKDSDLSELMKSLGDIQRSGQSREEEANKLRKEAESKSIELERSLAETRGQINILSHEKATLTETLESAKKELGDAGGSVNDLKAQLDGFRAELTAQTSHLQLEKELRARSEQKESEERTERIALSAQMVAMTKEHAQMETQLNEAKDVLESKWRKNFETQQECIQQKEDEITEGKETIAGLEGELFSLKEALNDKKSLADAQHVEEMSKLKGEINVLKEKIKTEEQKLLGAEQRYITEKQELEAQIREGQAERRKMHNTIQELRGNVRVFARIRPFLPVDGVDDDTAPSVGATSETSLKMNLNGDNKKEYKFSFDRVFSPSISQEVVFQEVSEFVQSALDGYNVCLFSYGQTGSGKTHTMQGSGLGQMRGIIPRAIEQVGRYKKELEAQGWQYRIEVSFLEIYNESIRDLLRDEESGETKHEIKVLGDGRRYVTNLTMETLEPSDSDAVNSVMYKASKQRSVATTSMNDVSSRSHSVFTLHLTAVHPENKQSLRGTLNLVDLAGSERLKRSGATGETAKEAMAINKSLSALTNVFVAIGTKSGFVPFRNSKLTYLLQPSLSGDGKTLMIVNLSPTNMSTQESLSSLRFASQVNNCELGKAKRSIEEVNCDDEDDTNSARKLVTPSASTPIKKVGSANNLVTSRRRLDSSFRSIVTPTSNIPKVRSTSSVPRLSGTSSSARKTSNLTRPNGGIGSTPPSRLPRKGSS